MNTAEPLHCPQTSTAVSQQSPFRSKVDPFEQQLKEESWIPDSQQPANTPWTTNNTQGSY